MEEGLRALGPFPFLQMTFGVVVLALGVWSIIRGLQAKPSEEEQRAEWKARQELEHLEENSWKIVMLLEKQNELLGRLISVIYNDRVR